MKISIIIPAYNASKTLRECLDSIKKQKTNFKFEIIVVDDGSEDDTKEIALNSKIRLIESNHGGPSSARNVGVKKSSGEIIVFIDSDCVAEPDWLKNMISPFDDPSVGAVGGPYSDKDTSNKFVSKFINTEISWRYSNIKNREIQGHGRYNLALRKEVFNKIGGFNKSFNQHATEDWDLTSRINHFGFKLLFVPNAKVKHYHDVSLKKYLKKQFFKGKWRIRLSKLRKAKKKDEYTGELIKYQIALTSLFLFSLVLVFFVHLFLIISLIILIILFLSNFSFGKFSYIKYKNLLIAKGFMGIQTLRIFCLTLGVISGIKNQLLKKWK